jgi:hypothetical protein
MGTTYWMANAEYIGVCYNTRQWLIGEDENADWWVIRHDDSWIRFNRRNPLHWLCYWNSRRRNQVVFLFG